MEFAILRSYIKYFVYGFNFFFGSFLVSKFSLRCSYVDVCISLDAEFVEMFVWDAVSETSVICRGTLHRQKLGFASTWDSDWSFEYFDDSYVQPNK